MSISHKLFTVQINCDNIVSNDYREEFDCMLKQLEFANRVQGLEASAIREIFKLLKQPDMISFAGGIPAPEMFPNEELAEIAKDILMNNGKVALQYGITEGYDALIEVLNQRMAAFNIGKPEDKLVIVSGGQQGIELAAKVFLNEGDGVVVEKPSFIGALNSFKSYNAELFSVNVENDGMNMDELENLLKVNNNIRLVYTIPTFQNPSGITMSLEKRQKLLQLADKYNFFIIEDNPYGELRFKGEDVASIKTMDDNYRVIYVGSFSKILSPGIRVGWVIAHNEIIEKIVVVKQVNDVHTNVLSQMMAVEYMNKYSIDVHIEKIRELYGRRCGFMLDCMDKYFPSFVDYTRPEGGLFIWCTLPEGYDTIEVMKESVKHKVAFVPGYTFMVDMKSKSPCFRLNYSTMAEENIEKGIKILGEVLSAYN